MEIFEYAVMVEGTIKEESTYLERKEAVAYAAGYVDALFHAGITSKTVAIVSLINGKEHSILNYV